MTPLDYLIRTNLYLLLFFGCYYLLLRRHTFFKLNRFYLLVSVALSMALPWVQLPQTTVAALPVLAPQMLTTVVIRPESVAITGPDWPTVALWVYGAVAIGLLIRLIWRTTRLLRYIHQHPQLPLDDFTLVQPADPQTPTFSFFRYMVLSPTDRQVEAVRAHELVHIRQWHSADVLFFEILQALLWFNPVLLAYRAAIRQVHEFLADAGASSNHRSDYAHYLVAYALGEQPEALANSFFKPSLLVSRLRMLQRRATSRWALSKYALVLPVVLVMLALTAARPEVERLVRPLLARNPILVKGRVVDAEGKALPGASVVVHNGTQGTNTDANGRFALKVEPGVSLVVSFVGFDAQEIIASSDREVTVYMVVKPRVLSSLMVVGYKTGPNKDASQPEKVEETFTPIEQEPQFPGGAAALGRYLGMAVRYPRAAHEANIGGKVFVEFTVTATGEVRNIRLQKGIGFGCDEEAVRVVAQMPRWEPGKQNSKPVDVQFVLPIEFAIEVNNPKTGYAQPQPGTGDVVPVSAPKADENGKPGSPFDSNESGNVTPASIQIRGTNTFYGKEPLYIIDGIPMDSKLELKRLSPNNIQSITVLKDASARAIYGEKGANGVIIITTKTGKKNGAKPSESEKH